MHNVVTIGMPMIAILFGIVWNQRAADKLEIQMDKRFGEVDRRFDRMESRMDRMQADLSGFIERWAGWAPRSRT